ncbi:MAG: hypothetical protein ACYSSK_10535 [Planctomycetota bacterium]
MTRHPISTKINTGGGAPWETITPALGNHHPGGDHPQYADHTDSDHHVLHDLLTLLLHLLQVSGKLIRIKFL